MEHRKLNRVIAGILFLISLTTYVLTTQSSVSFWDCGEWSAAAYTMAVPHPPGTPFFSIMGRFVGLILFFVNDQAMRLNLISAFLSAVTVAIMYLTIIRLMIRWRGIPKTKNDFLIMYGSAFLGALTFSFTDIFWFNAVEFGVYATSMFFLALDTYLALVWFEHADEPGSERYLIFIAYLMGLSLGVHQMGVLAFFTIGLLIYFRYKEVTFRSFVWNTILICLAFLILWPGLINWLPEALDGNFVSMGIDVRDSDLIRYLPIILCLGLVYGIYYTYKHHKRILNIAFTAVLFVILGYSTYTQILIRADAKTPMNENNPDNMKSFVSYMAREQYGEQPSFFDRRWNPEEDHQQRYANYTSDFDYLIRYQVYHMYLRYLGWNFVGRAGDIQDAPVSIANTEKQWQWSKGFPEHYFFIPLILGLVGLYYHFKKDWKFAFAFLVLFGMLGLILGLYFNMAEPQPRERDYFFVGSFYVFGVWIAIGIAGILEYIEKKIKSNKNVRPAIMYGGTLLLIGLIAPINVAVQNWQSHDRHGNFVAWDGSYNVLQSVEKDGILFTAGDNDTFPLWYLQDAEGVRRDVRIVNLSLVGTNWYIRQLKNEEPWGAKKIPIQMSDEEIDHMASVGGIGWKTQSVDLPVPKEVFQQYGITDTSIINKGKISWTLKSEGGGNYIRTARAMVKEILTSVQWKRPVYFASTVAPSDRIGLDAFLRLEGFAYCITPINGGNSLLLNEESFTKHFAQEPKVPSKERAFGFLFRNLSNPKMYFGQEDQRQINNYRMTWLVAAYHYNEARKPADAIKSLDMIEQKTPSYNFPIDMSLKADIANLYAQAGSLEKFDIYAKDVESEAWDLIHSRKVSSKEYGRSNPWRILLGIYAVRSNPTKELELYKSLIPDYPNDSSLIQRIEYLQKVVDAQAKSSTPKK